MLLGEASAGPMTYQPSWTTIILTGLHSCTKQTSVKG